MMYNSLIKNGVDGTQKLIIVGVSVILWIIITEKWKKEIVVLDDDKKAAMVSNLMVVLCGEKSASPVLNTGTLY